ncbi:rhamnan synthesis F family protein [Achromobacter spanius]|uniref:rhamnan synthesis F family protein n=1 Tax=Achromobacter spanius TaxID=217203 RepID=UPI003208B31E
MKKYFRALRTMGALGVSEGGLRGLLQKSVRMYRSEGVRGFKRLFSAAAGGHVRSGPIPNRPRDKDDFAFEIPFSYPVTRDPSLRACAVVHAFYPELVPQIRSYLERVPGQLDVYISTTSDEKRHIIESAMQGYAGGQVEIRVFPNRGRDIAPKLVGFADVYSKYDVALSLHTKKSPHGGEMLAPWRDYLYDHLLGSPEIVASIFELLRQDRIGMVFPQHFFPLRSHLAWGPNFESTLALLEPLGVTIEPDAYLECPSGSMFWCRTDALQPLLSLQLSFDSFPEEAGQTDGTFAHAIERAFLYSIEGAGYKWAKVVLPNSYPLPSTILPVRSVVDIEQGMSRVYRPLLGSEVPAVRRKF